MLFYNIDPSDLFSYALQNTEEPKLISGNEQETSEKLFDNTRNLFYIQ